ncbi:MAG: hypothetical protein RIQ52_2083 [Pseudomonadota bacterium]|jgi:CrcB protein
MSGWTSLLAVALGGGGGAMLRYLLGTQITVWLGRDFPCATLLINISGSLVMGLMAQYLQARWPDMSLPRLLVLTGLLGGYTTFSAFSLETLQLLQQGESGRGLLYILLSLAGCLFAVWLGDTLGDCLFKGKMYWPEALQVILYGCLMMVAGALVSVGLLQVSPMLFLGDAGQFMTAMLALGTLGGLAVLGFGLYGFHWQASLSLGQALELGLAMAIGGFLLARRLSALFQG